MKKQELDGSDRPEMENFIEEIIKATALNEGLPKDHLELFRQDLEKKNKAYGDILDNCLIELSKMDNKNKGLAIMYLLGTLPISIQMFIVES